MHGAILSSVNKYKMQHTRSKHKVYPIVSESIQDTTCQVVSVKYILSSVSQRKMRHAGYKLYTTVCTWLCRIFFYYYTRSMEFRNACVLGFCGFPNTCSGVPSSWILPSAMKMTLSATSRANAIS